MVLINSRTKKLQRTQLRQKSKIIRSSSFLLPTKFIVGSCILRLFVFFGGIGIVLFIFVFFTTTTTDGILLDKNNNDNGNLRKQLNKPSSDQRLSPEDGKKSIVSDGVVVKEEEQKQQDNNDPIIIKKKIIPSWLANGPQKGGMPGLKHSINNIQEQFHNWVAENPPYIPHGGEGGGGGGGKFSSNGIKSYNEQEEEENEDYHANLPETIDDDGNMNSMSFLFGYDDCTNFDHTIYKPKHGCEVNEKTYVVYCNFENLRIDIQKINVDYGGEILSSVMGRKEESELPKYNKGAFSVASVPKFNVPKPYRRNMHYMKDVLDNLLYPTKANHGKFDMSCSETWKGITMFITRYEYVNLFHTMTDWYNTFMSLPKQQGDNNEQQRRQRQQQLRVVFLDGHAEGNLDHVWSDVFGPYSFVKHLGGGDGGSGSLFSSGGGISDSSTSICFEKAIFIPPGYVSPIYYTYLGGEYWGDHGNEEYLVERSNCPNHHHANEFSNHILNAYNLDNVEPIFGKVIIIDRQHYVAHPRSDPNKTPRVLSNLKELKRAIRSVPGVTSVSLVRFETMTFQEQLETIRQSHVVIGNHGAGLSHVMFMKSSSSSNPSNNQQQKQKQSSSSPKPALIEFTNASTDYFAYMAEWKGVEFHGIDIDPDTPTLNHRTIGKVRKIVESKFSSEAS